MSERMKKVDWPRFRFEDAETGKEIVNVMTANNTAGTLTRGLEFDESVPEVDGVRVLRRWKGEGGWVCVEERRPYHVERGDA